MPKVASPTIRRALIERAAEMLARREPVTLRALVDGTGASTMAVYTHFGGMPGLWRAVRQEGFTRLAERVRTVRMTSDPVRDLVALGLAYVSNALANPALYRTMFDAGFDLDDPEEAASGLLALVACAERAKQTGRFDEDTDAGATALRFWTTGHGVTVLVLSGVLPVMALAEHLPPMTVALFVAAGDDRASCEASVRRPWRSWRAPVLDFLLAERR